MLFGLAGLLLPGCGVRLWNGRRLPWADRSKSCSQFRAAAEASHWLYGISALTFAFGAMFAFGLSTPAGIATPPVHRRPRDSLENRGERTSTAVHQQPRPPTIILRVSSPPHFPQTPQFPGFPANVQPPQPAPLTLVLFRVCKRLEQSPPIRDLRSSYSTCRQGA
jgi:hypothetical protein